MSVPPHIKAALIAVGFLVSLIASFVIASTDRVLYSVIQIARREPTALPAPPSLDPYTRQSIAWKIPAPDVPFITLGTMNESAMPVVPVNSHADDHAFLQDKDKADIIEIKGGRVSLSDIDAKLNSSAALEKTARGWLLKIPMVIHPEAALLIEGKKDSLLMAADTGAFISNFGKLFILNSNVTGWDEAAGGPALYAEKDIFRPYIVSWSGSETYLAQSRFLHLGFSRAKAYGITFSTSAFLLRDRPQTPRPRGWIIDCHFEDLYYGFYSYEADHIAIIGNEYKNNIVYGIDPHDRSQHLIIAGNEVHGTREKHGIIVSREVNDSWIFKNHSHDNAGSGIMIDRNSVRNVVLGNTLENNRGDGLVFIESSQNISRENIIKNNAKNGVRVRNSRDIILRGDNIAGNGLYGIDAYAASLDETGRDTEIDPYSPRVSLNVGDAVLVSNNKGQFRANNLEAMTLSNIQAFRSPRIFSGDIRAYEAQLLTALAPQSPVVTIGTARYLENLK